MTGLNCLFHFRRNNNLSHWFWTCLAALWFFRHVVMLSLTILIVNLLLWNPDAGVIPVPFRNISPADASFHR